MAVSTATPKGQVVIPAELRRKYRIEAGTKVSIADGDGCIVVGARASRSAYSSASPGGRPSRRSSRSASVKRGAESARSRRSRRRGFVLDSHALLAYFEGEPSGTAVRGLISEAERGRTRLYLSLINWGEVVYVVRREKGDLAVHEVVARIDILPITLRSVDRRLAQAAAALKAKHPIAYADAFAAATASMLQMPVVTGDPEFECLEPQIEILWTTRQPTAPS
jgi:AbrB family looped-hinge helix DNA binding protein